MRRLEQKESKYCFFKLNSNPYHYKIKFPLTSKQKFNSKFQGLETARILNKKRPNLDQKTLPISNNHEKKQQKRRKEKRRPPYKTPSFFFFLSSPFVLISHHHLHKNKKIVKNLHDVSVLFQHPLQSWDSRKNYLKVVSYLLPWGFGAESHNAVIA